LILPGIIKEGDRIMTENQPTKALRLLVIDDEAIVGKRLLQVFGKMGFTVEVFDNPIPAMEVSAADPFDIVVTDLKMAGMDGMEVLAQVRQHNPSTRVIIITGYAQPETEEEAFKLGVFDFIPKPFRLEELKESILKAVDELK
jgi:DNA-binding NtrC family response regulator